MGDSQDAFALFADLDDLWRDITGTDGERSIEAYDALFGPRCLHADLETLGARRAEFQRRFAGPVRVIADFAVTSAHEALAVFAERVAEHTRVRKTIPRLRDELEIARQRVDAGAAAKLEMDLGVACKHFARCMQSALKGWDENRAWIERSLREEKDAKAAVWNARDAVHRATMAVYADLGTLVSLLRKHRDIDVALLELDEYAPPGSAPEPGEPQGIADLKHAANRLRASLATAKKLQSSHGKDAQMGGTGGHFGSISTLSFHAAFLEAAAEVLEPDAKGASRSMRVARPQSESGAIRREIVVAALDQKAWNRLKNDLEHEYWQALLLPPKPNELPKPQYQPPEQVGDPERLRKAQHKVLNFLLVACYSGDCYRNAVRMLDSDLRAKKKPAPSSVRFVQEAIHRCRNAADAFQLIYSEVWSILVDAVRPAPGVKLAFQQLHEMAVALTSNWDAIPQHPATESDLHFLIDAGRYVLCNDQDAQVLWDQVNNEFAIAGRKLGLTLAPVEHPEAKARAVTRAILGPLLTNVKPSWGQNREPQAPRPTLPPVGSGPPPAKPPQDLVTIQDLAEETGIPYPTLTSRKNRMRGSARLKPVDKDSKRRDLYQRADWDPIIAAIRAEAEPDA